MIQFFRRTIAQSGTPTTRPNAELVETERFSGHSLRVSGAEWLSRLGMRKMDLELSSRGEVHRMAPLLKEGARTMIRFSKTIWCIHPQTA